MICQRRRSSRPPSNKDLAALVLPSSLNRVSPFLQEAQSCFRDENKADSKIVVYCVDHAVCYLTSILFNQSLYLTYFIDSLGHHSSHFCVTLVVWNLLLSVSLI